MEFGGGEEQERSRLEELAEEVMTKELIARKKELEDIEKAGYNFEGTRLELVADELLRSLPGRIRSPKRARARRYSDSSSSLSSSSPSSSGSFTPVNRSPERRSLHATMGTVTTSVVPDELQKILPALQRVVPVLAPGRHKGQAGKVAIIGGCREYTGAPYFAAISALKMGADLAHVFCTEGAATVIKSYSPELIVHPVLHESYDLGEIGEQEIGELKQKVLAEVGKWLERFDCIVIGPGLGRDPILLECVAGIIEEAKSKNIPLVLDGDGLFLVTNQPELIVGYPLAVLTPNVMEHKRLAAKLNPKEVSDEDLPGQLQELAKKFQGAKIVYEENEEDTENPEEKTDEEDPENPEEKTDEEEDPENPEEKTDEEDTENPEEKPDEEDPENAKEKTDEEDLPGQLQKLANKFQSAKIAGEDNQEAPGSLKEIPEEELPGRLQELAIKMEGVTIVQKGKTDYISDGKSVLSSDYYGSPRRCGGQGDVLSGSTAVFVSWAKAFLSNESADGKKDVQERISANPTMVGALAGSLLCRKSAANAFAQHRRSTVTTNIIECLGQSMDELFPM